MRPNSRYALLAGIVGVTWLFLVTFNYYIVHKPFSVENLLALLSVMGDLGIALILFAIASALGRRLTGRLNFLSRLEALVFEAGLGLGLVSFSTLALGMAGLINRLVFWGLIFIAGIVLRRDLLSIGRDLRAIAVPLESRPDRILAVLSGASLVIALVYALTPPIAWDAQTYHLVGAKTALVQGRIAVPPDVVYYSFPSLIEMLFLAAMLLKGDIAGQLVHYGFFILTLGLLLAFAQRYFRTRTGLIAAALLVSVPSFLAVATWAYVDVALSFYTFGALYAVLIARDSGDRRWLALSAALAGIAMGVKYTAAIVPIAILVTMLMNRQTRNIRGLSIFTLIAALFASPWYLRNLVLNGNPVYPFLFGGEFWDSFRAEWFSRFGTGLMTDPLKLLTAPWDATIYGREGGLGYEASIGPLILGLAPLLFLSLRLHRRGEDQPSVVGELLVMSGILYSFWLVGIAQSSLLVQTRLLFPAFPMLAMLAATALERLEAVDLAYFSLKRFAQGVMLLVVGITVLNYLLALASGGYLSYLVGAENREGFLARNLGPYGTMVRFVNTEIPKTARILLLWEPRSYYLQRTVQPDAILDSFPHMRWKYLNADAIAGALRDAGYTHIVLNRAGLNYLLQNSTDPITAIDLNELEKLVAQHLTPIYGHAPLTISVVNGKPEIASTERDAYSVYEIRGTGSQ